MNAWTMVKHNNELIALASTLRNACLIAQRVPGSVIEIAKEDVEIPDSKQISLNCFGSKSLLVIVPAKAKKAYRAAMKAMRDEYNYVHGQAGLFGVPAGKVIF